MILCLPLFNRINPIRYLVTFVLLTALGACAETQFVAQTVKHVSKDKDKTSLGKYKIGNPYQIKNVWYYPKVDYDYDETGIGSWYGAKFHGRKTANGEIYDMNSITAAHRTLPMPSFVRVTNLENGRTMNIRINDRGPYARGRILDLSRRSAQLLGFEKQGTARIRVRILEKESRAIARKLKGETELAEVGSPITVKSLPKTKVSSHTLPAIGSKDQISLVSAPVSRSPQSVVVPPNNDLVSSPPDEKVTVEKVSQQVRIYIQAGAFSNFENANKVRANLSGLGAKISSILINGQDFFRVRVGPMVSVDQADQMLERVFRSGYTEARTIVD
ncbi:MAG: hypothetical protein CMF71_04140 [Magnetovibrio sp.]|nr:hypothetical protein [Magnetovibrio sp.]|tara:strand:+ start:6830 stop:7822 length:993 start_codon:yes stop_codon:yes gene_type:complete